MADDLKLVRDTADIISRLINTREYRNMSRNDPHLFIETLKAKFPFFSKEYARLFSLIVTYTDMSFLDDILRSMENIDNGNAEFEAERAVMEEKLNKKYIYPVVGKPEEQVQTTNESITPTTASFDDGLTASIVTREEMEAAQTANQSQETDTNSAAVRKPAVKKGGKRRYT